MPAPLPSAATPVRPHQSEPGLSWPELGFLALVLVAGFCFLRDATYWARNTYIGTAQFGDAEFWWNGALHFSQGIIADNPNLVFRMGYATFAGLFVAVLGPDYATFHAILVTLFLVTAAGVYLSLRAVTGRVAAGAAIVFLVFNSFTAEWLAVSTSDALGLILNLAAVLALAAGVTSGLRLRWLALFSVLFACASLTRPLMTPFLLPALVAVVATGWPDWRRTARAGAVMLAAFLLPTIVWMGVMGLTTGNFALTGASQDSSAFFAASDPKIQSWSSEMYVPVNESAKRRHHTDSPTPRQLNEEFWHLTRQNYTEHWRHHLARLWPNARGFAAITTDQSTMRTPATIQWFTRFKWLATAALVVVAWRARRQWSALTTGLLGAGWAMYPELTPWLVLAGAGAGLVALLARRPGAFVWSAYWWVGVAAMYLVGGLMGPPLGPTYALTALGYRLGFQFLFANDFLALGLLGAIATGGRIPGPVGPDYLPLFHPAARAEQLLRRAAAAFFALLLGVLATGAGIVGWRVYARGHAAPVPFPDAAVLTRQGPVAGETLYAELDPLRTAIAAQDGRSILFTGQSGGFIWSMPGQNRSMLLVYQQPNVSPVALSPRGFYLEVASRLPEREWMNRQGAWVIRAYPDLPPPSSLPYYFEMPAIRAFIPLAEDGRGYDTARAVVFPIAKTATQLVKSGELVFAGPAPTWLATYGAQEFPRRFSLRSADAGTPLGWDLGFERVRGHRSVHFAVRLETKQASPPVRARLETRDGQLLWSGELAAGATEVAVRPPLPAGATGVKFIAEAVRPGDEVWFYELVLEADDFTQ